jgi:hypothetical protein
LAPIDLASRVLGVALTSGGAFLARQPAEEWQAFESRVSATLHVLGRETAQDMQALRAMAPQLLTRDGRMEELGIGMAQVDGSQQQVWDVLAPVLATVLAECADQKPATRLVPHLLRGFMHELTRRDRAQAERCLAQCAARQDLSPALPALQAAAGFDMPGLERMRQAYVAGRIPLTELDWLRSAVGASLDVQRAALAMLSQIASEPGGASVGVEALQSWLNLSEQPGAVPDSALIHACQCVLAHFTFVPYSAETPFCVMRVAQLGLQGQGAGTLAAKLASRTVAANREAHSLIFDFEELTALLVAREPEAVLSVLCQEDAYGQPPGIELLGRENRFGIYAVGQVDPLRLAAWCSANPTSRVPFVLQTIQVVDTDPATGRAYLTRHALTLLEQTCEPLAVLQQLVDRVDHLSWSAAKAAKMEHYALALDGILGMFDASFQAAACEAKSRLLAQAAAQRRCENEHERVQNERFEP